jgi:hypothetical protein
VGVALAVVVGASALTGLLVDRFHRRRARRLARARGDEEAALEGGAQLAGLQARTPWPSRVSPPSSRGPRAAARSGGEARHAQGFYPASPRTTAVAGWTTATAHTAADARRSIAVVVTTCCTTVI